MVAKIYYCCSKTASSSSRANTRHRAFLLHATTCITFCYNRHTTQLQPAPSFATSDIQKVASVQCHRGKLQPSTENATTFDEKSFNQTRDEFFTQALLKTKKVSIVYRKASTVEGKSYNRVNFLLLPSVCFLLHPFMRPWYFFATEV